MQWLEAEKMEALLADLDRDFSSFSDTGHLAEEIGQSCKELRAWGVLDSVLRMLQSPQEIFFQPDRFISYFISPAPPISNLRREQNSVFFQLSGLRENFPFVADYLKGALEGLPNYVGQAQAVLTWKESELRIRWEDKQESLFAGVGEEEQQNRYNPTVVQGIVVELEKTQLKLEQAEQELAELKKKVAVPVETASSSPALINVDGEYLHDALQEVFRVKDYMTRAQQLITLLVGSGRETPGVQEAMRRVRWNQVEQEVSVTLLRAIEKLQKVKESRRDRMEINLTKGE